MATRRSFVILSVERRIRGSDGFRAPLGMTKGSAWEYCQAMAIGQRALGRTGQSISAIGFGCGNQAGLLVRGEPREQVRVIARAIDLGITYFDTAAQYGNGVSEQNLGR
ncbi:MAG TPA: aldo/keto reductase, partial [Chloroflexota bacterium]